MSFGRAIAPTVLLLAIVAGCAWLYFYRLDFAPPNIQIDEAIIAINAHSIATTGRDLRGELLPLYAQTADHSWYQPLVIYLTAIALKFSPLSEWSVRVPAVVMSVLGVGLMFLVVRRATHSLFLGAAGAAMLALTPALFIHSRYAMDYHYPIPFILGWLYCLLRFDDGRRIAWLVASAVILGVGFYCYISSIVMMPIYFLMTLMWLYMRREPPRSYAAAALGMGPLLLPFAIWIAQAPHRLRGNGRQVRPVRFLGSQPRPGTAIGLWLPQRRRAAVALLELLRSLAAVLRQRHQGAVLHQPGGRVPAADGGVHGARRVCGAEAAFRAVLSDRAAGFHHRSDRGLDSDRRERDFPRARPAAVRSAAGDGGPGAAVAPRRAAIARAGAQGDRRSGDRRRGDLWDMGARFPGPPARPRRCRC